MQFEAEVVLLVPGGEFPSRKKSCNHTSKYCRIFYFVQVRDKYCSAENISWSSAADEVKVELLTARYEEGGRKPCDDPLLVLLKTWPAREEFLENPRLIEGQVCF